MRKNIKLIKYYLSCVFISLVCTTGCKKDWLDAKSDKALTVPESLKDFQALLDNASMFQQYPVLGEIASDGHYVAEIIYQNAVKGAIPDAYLWKKSIPHNNISDWFVSYTKVLWDNIILDGVAKIKTKNDAEIKQLNEIKGQALFNRARTFFELAQIYAPPYSSGQENKDLGIVLRLTSDITIPSKRSTVSETYAQIIMDLSEAKKLLPTRPSILTRASSSSTYALLARVYLSMQDYENAFLCADNSLKQYSSLLDYNDVLANANFIGLYNKEVLLHSNYTPVFSTATNNLIEQSLFDLYKLDDLRRTRFYRVNANQTISYKGMYENVTNNYFNGLATDEVYLIRAECHARAGRTIDALNDLNNLIIKRWNKNVPYPIITASSATDALSIILTERKKELIFRGVRWMDLRRLNKDPNFAITLKRTIAGVEYVLEPNSYKYTFPIPDDIIQQTGMQQNPGWP